MRSFSSQIKEYDTKTEESKSWFVMTGNNRNYEYINNLKNRDKFIREMIRRSSD